MFFMQCSTHYMICRKNSENYPYFVWNMKKGNCETEFLRKSVLLHPQTILSTK